MTGPRLPARQGATAVSNSLAEWGLFQTPDYEGQRARAHTHTNTLTGV